MPNIEQESLQAKNKLISEGVGYDGDRRPQFYEDWTFLMKAVEDTEKKYEVEVSIKGLKCHISTDGSKVDFYMPTLKRPSKMAAVFEALSLFFWEIEQRANRNKKY